MYHWRGRFSNKIIQVPVTDVLQGHPCAEDCGGAPAWTELKKLFAKKDKPDPEKRKTWYRTECASGKRSGLDPWKWDINLVNKQLGIYADFICA